MSLTKPYVTKQEIEQARQLDLLSYLQQHEPEELVRFSSNVYTLRSHDSLKISNGKWYQWSTGIGGISALDYLIKVQGMDFVSAVSKILSYSPLAEPARPTPAKRQKPVFTLPAPYENNDRVRTYLTGRGLSMDLLRMCIDAGLIYEDMRHNCVFVGFDRKKVPRYAMLRSMGYGVKTGVKHMAVRPPGKERFVRLRSLGERYAEDAIRQRILKQRAPERPAKCAPSIPLRIRVHGDFHLSKVTWKGLRALYFFYLRKLRRAQRAQQCNVPYVLREDLRHLDAIDAQTRFLFRHGIDSTDQLDLYRACADERLTQLYTERKALRNEQRRTGIPDERMAEIRARIVAISEQAKLLRNELKLCDAITKRAFALSKQQEQMKQLQREEQDVGCHRHPSKTSLKIY